MKHTSFIFYIALLFTSVAMFGCIREKEMDCPPSTHYLLIRSFDADNRELTGSGAVQEVVLYVFSGQKLYLETVICKENEQILLMYNEPRITVVAWGNSKSGHQQMPVLKIGTSLEDAEVTLLNNVANPTGSYSLSPDDLFFGTSEIDLTQTPPSKKNLHEVLIKRKASSMNITIKGLKEWAGTAGGDFSVVVNSGKKSIDFHGKLTGNIASYDPVMSFDTNGSFVSGIFNTFPSGESTVSIDIYQGTTLIYSVSTDADGQPFSLAEGRLLNVFIDLTGNAVWVSISVTKWGEADINQEF